MRSINLAKFNLLGGSKSKSKSKSESGFVLFSVVLILMTVGFLLLALSERLENFSHQTSRQILLQRAWKVAFSAEVRQACDFLKNKNSSYFFNTSDFSDSALMAFISKQVFQSGDVFFKNSSFEARRWFVRSDTPPLVICLWAVGLPNHPGMIVMENIYNQKEASWMGPRVLMG